MDNASARHQKLDRHHDEALARGARQRSDAIEMSGGKREELAALGIRLIQARLMAAPVDANKVRETEQAVAELQQTVLQLGHPLLAVRWFLATQGPCLQRAMWPERRSPLVHEELLARLEPGCALVLMSKAPDAQSILLVLLREADGRTDLRLRAVHAGAPPSAALRTLHAMAPDIANVSLVPAGELRCVPWQHHAASTLLAGTRLRVHPTVATWWRQKELAGQCDLGRTADSPLWLLVAQETRNGDPHRLRWAQIESMLSVRLWKARAVLRLQEGSAVGSAPTALLSCGHDTCSQLGADHNGRINGLATILRRQPGLRQAILAGSEMNCVDDATFGPCHFLDRAFARGLRFALIPVRRLQDVDSALLSLAYQWCLRCAFEQPAPGGDVDWVDVFELLQATLRMGEWPPGFASWLLAELPSALDDAVPDVAASGADEAAHLERTAWFWLLRGLAAELGMPDAMPSTKRCWKPFYERFSMALSQRVPQRIRTAAQWMVAIGE